jgi:hypothetical protein
MSKQNFDTITSIFFINDRVFNLVSVSSLLKGRGNYAKQQKISKF